MHISIKWASGTYCLPARSCSNQLESSVWECQLEGFSSYWWWDVWRRWEKWWGHGWVHTQWDRADNEPRCCAVNDSVDIGGRDQPHDTCYRSDEVIYTSACVLRRAVHRSVDSTSGLAFLTCARGCTDLSAYLTIIDTGSLPVSSGVAPPSRLAATRRTNDRLHNWVLDGCFDATQRKWDRPEDCVDWQALSIVRKMNSNSTVCWLALEWRNCVWISAVFIGVKFDAREPRTQTEPVVFAR